MCWRWPGTRQGTTRNHRSVGPPLAAYCAAPMTLVIRYLVVWWRLYIRLIDLSLACGGTTSRSFLSWTTMAESLLLRLEMSSIGCWTRYCQSAQCIH
jgi:hypothetical protein